MEGERKYGDRYGETRSVIYLANALSLRPSQPVAKKLVTATGAVDYNILQNNGRIAHQLVDHVSLASPPNDQMARSPNDTQKADIMVFLHDRFIFTW